MGVTFIQTTMGVESTRWSHRGDQHAILQTGKTAHTVAHACRVEGSRAKGSRMELWPVLPMLVSLEMAAQERKQTISLLKEELWEQSQASQAADQQLPLSRAHREHHSGDSLAGIISDAGVSSFTSLFSARTCVFRLLKCSQGRRK